MKKNKLKIHFIYVTGILLSVIIFLISHDFGDKKDLVQYLSFGLGLTSLVVGLIAIFQTFFSGDAINKSILKLENASNVIIENAQNLEKVVSHFNNTFAEVPVTLSKIQEKLESQNSSIIPHDQKVAAPVNLNLDLVQSFLNTSSLRGLVGLYAVLRSYEKKKSFQIETFEITTDLSFTKYTHGYLVASSCLGLFTHIFKDEVWTIPSINEHLKLVEKLLEKRLKENTNKPLVDLIVEMRAKTDAYFLD
jgi:hypothetical protein